MKTVKIHGEIGWEVWSSDVLRKISEADGIEDLVLDISSPGGIVLQGIDIFNAIRAYAGKTIARVTGMAASIASYFVMAADEVEVYDNAILMIHNPVGGIRGDHRAMQSRATMLKAMTNLLAKAYVDKSGKSLKDILAWMEAETFFFGQEIADQGFADKVLDGGETTNKDESIALLKTRIDAVIAKNQTIDNFEIDKMVAIFGNVPNTVNALPERVETKQKERKIMDRHELKEKHPALYTEIYNLGGQAEGKRVKAHMNMLIKGIAVDYAKEAIAKGTPYDEEAQSHYIGEAINKNTLDTKIDDNVNTDGVAAATVAAVAPEVVNKQKADDLFAAVMAASDRQHTDKGGE